MPSCFSSDGETGGWTHATVSIKLFLNLQTSILEASGHAYYKVTHTHTDTHTQTQISLWFSSLANKKNDEFPRSSSEFIILNNNVVL